MILIFKVYQLPQKVRDSFSTLGMWNTSIHSLPPKCLTVTLGNFLFPLSIQLPPYAVLYLNFHHMLQQEQENTRQRSQGKKKNNHIYTFQVFSVGSTSLLPKYCASFSPSKFTYLFLGV